jgi:hypothetical protein
MTAFAAFDLANFLTVLGGYVVASVSIFLQAVFDAFAGAILPP